MKKNVASQSIGAEMITAADGTAFAGTVTVLITIDNGTQSASGGTAPAHEGNGYHSYTPTQAETNGDHVAFTFTGTGAVPATVQVFTAFPQTVDNATGIADIPTVAEFNARTLVSASYFDPAVDTVANVTTVATTTTNSDMRGTDSALLAANLTAGAVDNVTLVATTTTNTDMRGTDSANTVVPPSVAQFNARTILSADYFDPAVDAVANVTLCATTTTNTDQRGTDSAALASVCTETRLAELDAGNIPADIDAIPTTAMRGTDSALLAASINLTAGAVDNVTTVATTTTNTDMVAEPTTLLTTQMTEAYAADNVDPTVAQCLFMIQQTIGDFSISGTTITTKKIDGSTTASTYTLDDGTNPTSRTRAT